MTRDEIFDKIRDVLVDALGVDEDEVKPGAKLRADLGAESIDYLDITFKIEQAFGFKIAQGELVPDPGAGDPSMVADGKLTATGLARMKERLPHLDYSGFEKDPQVSRIEGLFTVDALVTFVERKLAKVGTAA